MNWQCILKTLVVKSYYQYPRILQIWVNYSILDSLSQFDLTYRVNLEINLKLIKFGHFDPTFSFSV